MPSAGGTARAFEIANPAFHGNPNLHAQDGVFTLCDYGPVSLDAPSAPASLEQRIRSRWAGFESVDPFSDCTPLYKFTLNVQDAGGLLHLLAKQGVDGGSIYSGYPGAVRALREQEWWSADTLREKPTLDCQRAKEPNRWNGFGGRPHGRV